MAKMFYSAEEAATQLGVTTEELNRMAREGKIREFRDAGTVNYKVNEIDALARPQEEETVELAGEESGELVLEPAEEEDSALEVKLDSGSDVLSLADIDKEEDADKTATGADDAKAKKEGTVVPSVGVSVFDDDELDELVDPLAQTHVSDAGMGFEGIGSGSGILDVALESDDTSLGALLDEIEPTNMEGATLEMGDKTRAGLAEDTTEEEEPMPVMEEFESVAPAAAAAAGVAAAPRRASAQASASDAASAAMTALLVAGTAVIIPGGLAAIAMVRDVFPRPLDSLYEYMPYFTGGAAGVALLAGLITFFIAKR